MSGAARAGGIADALRAEFPGLRLWWARHGLSARRSTPGLQERLRVLSGRFHGADAVVLRTRPVPLAYRTFYRQVGLDPDEDRTPAEAAAADRLLHGGFVSRGLIEDAVLVAVVETGVPVWALDDATLSGDLGIREAGERETLGRGEHASDARPRRLVVADDVSPVAELFRPPAPGHAVTKATTAVRVFTVQVPGVPAIHVEEAMWVVEESLDSALADR